MQRESVCDTYSNKIERDRTDSARIDSSIIDSEKFRTITGD